MRRFPAEYILLKHYLDEPIEPVLEAKFAAYLRRQQGAHGGWPLFQDGDFDMSASVKAYFALKMIGDDADAPHMARAREAILARGGASQPTSSPVSCWRFTACMTWNSVPVMPVEIMLLPRWFPFHLTKISYWARTVIAPLLVLQALKPRARNPRGIRIDELFVENARDIGPPQRAPHQSRAGSRFFRAVDVVLRAAQPWFPRAASPRHRPCRRLRRPSGSMARTGSAPSIPAMANSVMMFDALGYPADHPDRAVARAAVEKLVVIDDRRGLLPALRFAGVGHRARVPCPARSGR